ncbi:hypothetical protein [Sphingobium mellinum]|uniref:hypothetical protein n=1 Tax=Sphingobium mellinum TaxID=1387166 RepID=UPI0030ECEB48
MTIQLIQKIHHIVGQAVATRAESGTQRVANAFIRLRQADRQYPAMRPFAPFCHPAGWFAVHFHDRTTAG